MHKTVAKHYFTLGKRGAHDVVQVLNARRSIQKGFAKVVHFFVFCVKNDVADLFGNGTAARLSGKHHVCEVLLLAVLA